MTTNDAEAIARDEADKARRRAYAEVFESPMGRAVWDDLQQLFADPQKDVRTIESHALLAYEAGTDRVINHIREALKPYDIHDGGDLLELSIEEGEPYAE